LKKKEEYPLGPGDLSSPMLKRAFSISSFEIATDKEACEVESSQGPQQTTVSSRGSVAREVPKSCW
jgi:hypothetical protein